jgi:hypothetical protein
MASRQSTSKAHQGRNRAPSSSRRTRSTRPKRRAEEPEPKAFGPLRDAIEHERGELTRAESVLGCLAFALLYSDWINEDPPDYASVAGVLPASVHDTSVIGLIRFLRRSVRAMGGRHGETEGRRHGAAAGVIRAA